MADGDVLQPYESKGMSYKGDMDDIGKLFIGQVPRQMTEQELRKIFEPFGPISEVTILRDRITNSHKGCAFLTYTTRVAAEKAINAVHNKITLHHTKRPVQVRFAGKEHEPRADVKIFVGMLAKSTTESQVHDLFGSFGKVKEVYIMKDNNQKSKGCGFVKFENRLDAQKAIAGLHDVYQDEGAPRKLIVKYADTKEERMQRTMAKQFNAYNPFMSGPDGGFRNPGFPSVSGFGGGAYAGGGPSGFGSSFHSTNEGFSGGGGGGGYGFGSSFGGSSSGSSSGGNYGSHFGGPSTFHSGSEIGSGARGPTGANLFVYNIPESFTDGDLHSMFSNFGSVLSALVFKNKLTGISKGFGFVSYDSPLSAEKAIVALNGFQIGNKRLKVMLKKGNGGASDIGSLTRGFGGLGLGGTGSSQGRGLPTSY